MLTAAVRDIHLLHPGEFCTDVRTSAPDLWQNNPFITRLDGRHTETIDCHYPLIHRSNQEPWHFIHGFQQYLSDKLGISLHPTAFRGDIHLSSLEKSWISQVHEVVGSDMPFWIIVSGGKTDYTAKLWSVPRLQAVVDRFARRVAFVQVGEAGHNHPDLSGVIDLRGKTDLRQLIRLVHHAQGVLSPVTLVMHLAAAVEVKGGFPKNRPCVVVAGGREPPQWETYPHHQFLHRVGCLSCCDNGGCWKSRVVALGDGDEKDRPENLCVDVVNDLPRCMDMIRESDVVRAVESYFIGGVARYLDPDQWRRIEPHLTGADRIV
ncbi:MAG: glycosyltransferase family 9 protein [Candidatus Cybelea sp.]